MHQVVLHGAGASGLGESGRYSDLLGVGRSRDRIPVAERSKARVYGRSRAGIAGSNPAGGIDVCVVQQGQKAKPGQSTRDKSTAREQKKIPGVGEIFCTCPDRPWGPKHLHNGYRVSFPRVKWPWRGVNHPPPSGAEIKERVELYLSSLSGPSRPALG